MNAINPEYVMGLVEGLDIVDTGGKKVEVKIKNIVYTLYGKVLNKIFGEGKNRPKLSWLADILEGLDNETFYTVLDSDNLHFDSDGIEFYLKYFRKNLNYKLTAKSNSVKQFKIFLFNKNDSEKLKMIYSFDEKCENFLAIDTIELTPAEESVFTLNFGSLRLQKGDKLLIIG